MKKNADKLLLATADKEWATANYKKKWSINDLNLCVKMSNFINYSSDQNNHSEVIFRPTYCLSIKL